MMYLLLFIFISASVYGKTIYSVLDLGARYDNIDRGKINERIQQRTKLYSDFGLTNKFHFKVMMSSGRQYKSSWNTVRSLNEDDKVGQYYNLRRFYGDYRTKDYSFQLGIIPPNVSRSRTNIVTDGWVEGLQIKRKTDRFSGYAVAGSIDDVDHPGVINRTRSLNFGKLKGLYHFPRIMFVALGGIQLESDRYVQWELRNSPFQYPFTGLGLSYESLFNTETSGRNHTFTLSFKPLEFIREELKDYLKIELSEFRIDPEIGILGTLTDDFYTFGSTRFVGASGKITRNGNFKWFMEEWDNDVPRFKFGILFRYEWQEKDF